MRHRLKKPYDTNQVVLQVRGPGPAHAIDGPGQHCEVDVQLPPNGTQDAAWTAAGASRDVTIGTEIAAIPNRRTTSRRDVRGSNASSDFGISSRCDSASCLIVNWTLSCRTGMPRLFANRRVILGMSERPSQDFQTSAAV